MSKSKDAHQIHHYASNCVLLKALKQFSSVKFKI